jgi:hypothetical protein
MRPVAVFFPLMLRPDVNAHGRFPLHALPKSFAPHLSTAAAYI